MATNTLLSNLDIHILTQAQYDALTSIETNDFYFITDAVKPVVAWTAGSTAGPKLAVTVNGLKSSAATIPSASASASGIITTGAQILAGNKTFNGILKITNNESSTTSTTGALVVSGGIGAAGNINAAGYIQSVGSYIRADTHLEAGGHLTVGTYATVNQNLTVKGITTSGNIIPRTNSAHTLGSAGYNWSGIYLGNGTYYWHIDGNNTITSSRSLYLPDSSGTLITATKNSAVGGATQPVYVNNSSAITAISDTIGSDEQPMYLQAGVFTPIAILSQSYGGTGTSTVFTTNSVIYQGASGYQGKTTASGALYATSTNGTLAFGTLPIAQGGTGATTASAARTALEVPPTSHASSATTYGVSTTTQYGHIKITTGNGLSLSSGTLSMKQASATQAGAVTVSTQTFAGAKTFSGAVTFNNNTNLNGAILLDATSYGTSLPSSGTNGQLFFLKAT